MEITKYFRGYEDYMKYGLKALGISAGCFVTGFLGYVLMYRKELMQGEDIETKSGLKKIDIDKLEKIVSKIKNLLIHHMITMYDMLHKNDAPKDDIEIIDVKQSSDDAGENSEDLSLKQSSSQISKTTNKKNDSTIDAFQRQFRPLLDKQKLRDEGLLEYEIAKIKEYGYEPEEYYDALKKNIDNEKIKKHVQLLAEFKKCFDRDQLLKINFGEPISKNYLKIISNIYYLNMRKSQKKFKDEFLDQGYDFKDAKESLTAFNGIYKSFLKETRQQVVDFFQITPMDTLPPKVLLRIYPIYFPAHSELRKNYEKTVQQVTFLTKKIQSGFVIDELYDDKNPQAITSPINRVIDFSHLIEIQSAPKNLIADLKKGETKRSNRVLNKFGEVYEGKGEEDNEDLD